MGGERVILHVDMDAFYASVEQRDNPELRGRPVIVGGTGDRGVAAAASYEARKFGVHSAMPTRRARKLCPDATYLRPRMADYQRESRRVFDIFGTFTPLVEGLSLDEAFLDVSGSERLLGSPRDIGLAVKRRIRDETGLVASVGIAPNKFLAKLASDHDKPDGLCIVSEDGIAAFLDPLPIERMWGIGRKSAPLIRRLGVETIGDLRKVPFESLVRVVGRVAAERYLRLARGEDDRPVVPDRDEKSVSNEVTLDEDLTDLEGCRRVLLALSQRVGRRLRAKAIAGRTVHIKIRNRAFRTWTRSHSLEHGVCSDRELIREASDLMETWWLEYGPAEIRLLGVGVSHLAPSNQADLFGADHTAIDDVHDRVRDRFGSGALKPAALIRRSGDDDEKPPSK